MTSRATKRSAGKRFFVGCPVAAGAQPLGELVAARLAVELVLGRIDLGRLLQDFLGDLLVVARRVMGRCGRDLVPSTATMPTFTSPARAHSPSTPPNSAGIACSWRA